MCKFLITRVKTLNEKGLDFVFSAAVVASEVHSKGHPTSIDKFVMVDILYQILNTYFCLLFPVNMQQLKVLSDL